MRRAGLRVRRELREERDVMRVDASWREVEVVDRTEMERLAL